MTLFGCSFLPSLVQAAEKSPPPPDYRLDPELFRRGLIDRGFDAWLNAYDKDHPPASDLDLMARQIGQAWLEYRRSPDEPKRRQALENLLDLELDRIESYPDHPLAANWRVRYAGDLLNERFAALAFLHLLGFDVPGDRQKEFTAGLDRIDSQLDKARDILHSRRKQFDTFTDQQLAQVNRQGLPELYQAALLQTDYLWCWSRFHRAKLLAPGSSTQVAVLYPLSDRLEKLVETSPQRAGPGAKLLYGAVLRLLGKPPAAKIAMTEAKKNLAGSYRLFADLELANLALAENQPAQALAIVREIKNQSTDQTEGLNPVLAPLAVDLVEARARLAAISGGEASDTAIRNQIWKNVTTRWIDQPALSEVVLTKVRMRDESIPHESLADLELFAVAAGALREKKVPLAQSMLSSLLARKSPPGEMKASAALLLAQSMEAQGRFSEAAGVLGQALTIESNRKETLTADSARLAWLAYRAAPNDRNRDLFIKTAGRFLDQFPQSESADQFKLLMAEELSQAGQFDPAKEWITQIPPGSPRYLQAKAALVLILSRQCRKAIALTAATTSQPSSALAAVTDQLETACQELITIASARQAQPEKIPTWKLPPDQVQLLAGVILSTGGILSDPAVGRAAKAQALLSKYRPILDRYEKTSKTAVLTRIAALSQGATPEGLAEAIRSMSSVIETENIPADQTVAAVIQILDSVHRIALTNQADPLGRGIDLSLAALDLARRSNEKYSAATAVPTRLRDRLSVLAVATAMDAGDFAQVARWLKGTSPSPTGPDIDLARARAAFFEKQYPETVGISAQSLANLSPADIRYWHLLILNLQAHLSLGSDPEQIAAAVVARQQEFPDLGNPATKGRLLDILRRVQAAGKK